jgi:thiamine biosynthesis lipoprotein
MPLQSQAAEQCLRSGREASQTGRVSEAAAEFGRVRRARPLLGTRVEIRAAGAMPLERLHAAVDAAFAAVQAVHRLMCYHDPASELSRLNREALHGAQSVDPHTYRVLAAALRFARLGDGCFDPCIAPTLERFGYLPCAAGRELAADAAATPAGWRDIELTADRRVRFHRPLRMDLGGIAKGYAVDRAVRELEAAGVDDIVVNAGGDLRVAGERVHEVQLRHPAAPGDMGHALELKDAALATSAAYFSGKRLAARQVSALIDPRSGEPQVAVHSVSVRACDCMTADALTKVLMFAPAALAEQALAACDAQALVLMPGG